MLGSEHDFLLYERKILILIEKKILIERREATDDRENQRISIICIYKFKLNFNILLESTECKIRDSFKFHVKPYFYMDFAFCKTLFEKENAS